MIRVVIYLVIVGLLAVGAVWLADRPGEVVITWQNRRIEMSVMVLIMAAVAIAIVTTLVWSAVRAILRAPDVLWLYLSKRRGVRGYMAVSQGLVAIGSGDARAARKHADEASRIAPDEPLTLLLTAQASQLSGDREAAERAFHVMAGRDDTRLLGLHGLFVEAQRRNDLVAARLYAEEAAQSARAPAWAGLAVFNARCAAGDFTGALEQLDRNSKSGLVDRAAYRRHRAVLLTARAMESEEHDRTGARSLVLEAVKNEPTLIPAAALAGRLLGEAGEMRRAARVVEAAWKANPHPDLAEAYAHLQPGDSARDRLKRIESLAKDAPGNIEGALAVARAALDAQEFAIARACACAAVDRADPARGDADGGAGGEGKRRHRSCARMDGARGFGAARSGLDRGRDRFRPLDAGVASVGAARRLPVEGSDRRGRFRRWHDRARQGANAGYQHGTACARAWGAVIRRSRARHSIARGTAARRPAAAA